SSDQSQCSLCNTYMPHCTKCSSYDKCTNCEIISDTEQYFVNTSNKCGTCQSIITNCQKCYSNTTCSTCLTKYFPNSGQCALCSSVISDCETCNSGTECTKCINNKYLKDTDRTKCFACGEIMAGCTACTSGTVCTTCSDGYYINSNSKCGVCSTTLTTNCTKCSSGTTCTDCNLPSYLKNGKCVGCSDMIPQCKTCNSGTECAECSVGYFIDGNKQCTLCPSGCSECSSLTMCTKCSSNKILYTGDGLQSCVACNDTAKGGKEGCNECNQDGTCIGCEKSTYVLDNDMCKRCNTTMALCKECNSLDSCTLCETGYGVYNKNECKVCDTQIANCIECTTIDTCTKCSNKNPPAYNTCVICLEGCEKCTDLLICTKCLDNYIKMENGNCVKCSTFIPNCDTCTNETVCTNCSDPYMIFDGNCTLKTTTEAISKSMNTHLKQFDSEKNRNRTQIIKNKITKKGESIQNYMDKEIQHKKKLISSNTKENYYKHGQFFINIKSKNSDEIIQIINKESEHIVLSDNNKNQTVVPTKVDSIPSKMNDTKPNKVEPTIYTNSTQTTNTIKKQQHKSSTRVIVTPENTLNILSKILIQTTSFNSNDVIQYVLDTNKTIKNSESKHLKMVSSNCGKNQYEDQTHGNSCVDVPSGCYKRAYNLIQYCTQKIYGCYQCNYTTDDALSTYDTSKLLCLSCMNGYALLNNRCLQTAGITDSSGNIVMCSVGCNACNSSTFCFYTKSQSYTTRNGELIPYTNDEYCQKYKYGFGCYECSNSISNTGSCSGIVRKETCSFYLKTSGEDKCVPYIETVPKTANLFEQYHSNNINFVSYRVSYKTLQNVVHLNFKSEFEGCYAEKYGRCLSCKDGYYMSNDQTVPCKLCSSDCNKCVSQNECLICRNGNVIDKNGACVPVGDCAHTALRGCDICHENYFLKNGTCKSLQEHYCLFGIASSTEIPYCTKCLENYVLENGVCRVKSEVNCVIVDPQTSTCTVCTEGYQLDVTKKCTKISISMCSYANSYACMQCISDATLDSSSGSNVCLKELNVATTTSTTLCVINGVTGCQKCADGYYVSGTMCKPCSPQCGKCYDSSSNCVTCGFGYYNSSGACVILEGLATTCQTFLPGGDKCAVCKDGYILKDSNCFACNEACEVCYGSLDNCTRCSFKNGYYQDLNTSTLSSVVCLSSTTLGNCDKVTSDGCAVCSEFYYRNNYKKCDKCGDGCKICKDGLSCEKCIDDYVYKNTACVPWQQLSQCTYYDDVSQKCSKCNDGYSLNENGNECQKDFNYAAVITPIVIGVILILIIIFVFLLVYFLVKKHNSK
ncbi:hypothetical protein EIN_432100, partial [Entamoeba invadens IP1]